MGTAISTVDEDEAEQARLPRAPPNSQHGHRPPPAVPTVDDTPPTGMSDPALATLGQLQPMPKDLTVSVDLTAFAEAYESSILRLDKLTPHQAEKLDEGLMLIDAGRSLHIKAPAGAGKTFVALHLILQKLILGSVLFVAVRCTCLNTHTLLNPHVDSSLFAPLARRSARRPCATSSPTGWRCGWRRETLLRSPWQGCMCCTRHSRREPRWCS